MFVKLREYSFDMRRRAATIHKIWQVNAYYGHESVFVG